MFERTETYPYEIPGHGRFYADPLTVRRALLVATSGRCWEWAQEARHYQELFARAGAAEGAEAAAQRAEFSARQAEAEGRLAQAAYAAFGLPPVDPQTGHGVTETAALAILQDFLGYLEGKGGRPGS